MAENKKGFVLYADQKLIFEDLTNEEAGILIKHIFAYVNDENPIFEDRFLDMAFKPIKLQLKRDLVKYEAVKERNSANARKRWDAVASSGIPEVPNSTKNADKDKGKGIDKGIDKDKDINIEQRKLKFSESLKPFLITYGKDMLNDFYSYWTEPNKSGTKFKKELQVTWDTERRLKTWANNSFGNKNNKQPFEKPKGGRVLED